MCQILCGVSTVRDLAITKQIVRFTVDMFALIAVREVTTTIPPPANISLNVSIAEKITLLDPANVKYGRKRKKSVKLKYQKKKKKKKNLETKTLFENQTPELDFTKIVFSLSAKPEFKTIVAQFFESDFTINPSLKVICPSVKPKSQPKPTSVSQSQSSTHSQSNSRSRSGSSRSHSQSGSSLVLSLVLNQILRPVRKRRKKSILVRTGFWSEITSWQRFVL